MSTVPELLAVAVEHHQSGRLPDAERIYRQVLAVDPQQVDALHLLGVVAHQVKRHDIAAEIIQKAIALNPHEADFYNSLGNALKGLGRMDEARACHEKALALRPQLWEGHCNLGNLRLLQRDFAGAVACFREALRHNPNHAGMWLDLANALRAQENWSEAVACLFRVLQLQAPTTAVLLSLSEALTKQGKLKEALAALDQAMELEPDNMQALIRRGNLLRRLGDLDAAVVSLRLAVDLAPTDSAALFGLGKVLSAQGKLDDSIACHRRVVELFPQAAPAHHALAMALMKAGHRDEALASLRQTTMLDPENSHAHNSLGNHYLEKGDRKAAAACYRRVLEIDPNCSGAHNNLGNVLLLQWDLVAAEASFRRALELNPRMVTAMHNLGSALVLLGRPQQAVEVLRQAVEIDPACGVAHNKLGNALGAVGDQEAAIACYRRALELDPKDGCVLNDLGNALFLKGRMDEAIDCFRRLLTLDPTQIQAINTLLLLFLSSCDWRDVDGLTRNLLAAANIASGEQANDSLDQTVPSVTLFYLPELTSPAVHLKCAQRRANLISQSVELLRAEMPESEMPAPVRPSQSSKKRRPLRIGYLSVDFRQHAVASLVAELFEQHDRQRFRVHGYSYGPDDGGSLRRRLRQGVDEFIDIRTLSPLDAARRIREDQIDILVDLTGYTRDTRTEILALRPAPIQVNYLGFPGTMGASFMDYIVVDEFVVPASQQQHFSEKLVHLPGCYQANDSHREVDPRTPTRQECGLPPSGFVFCSFNNPFKITPAMFTVWMNLLKAVPHSVLWLYAGNRFVVDNLCREAASRGVDPSRLVFAPPMLAAQHMARHRLADLFLDTFPYTAHTTASDALWMGCPLVTLTGETFATRVAGSLLSTMGLPELITSTLEDYSATALRLAREPKLLGDLKARLFANRRTSPLFDAKLFARNLERAYVTMWETYAAGKLPAPIRIAGTKKKR